MREPEDNGGRWRLNNVEKRLEALQMELRDRTHKLDGAIDQVAETCREVPGINRRLEHVERLELNVLVSRVTNLEKRIESMTKAVWVLTTSLLVTAATFVLTVASGQIG